MTKSLWGPLPNADSVTPPVAILRQQAAELGDATNNVLQGEVFTRRDEDTLESVFDIIAPALDNYRYTVLTISYGVELYPVRLYSQVSRNWMQCNDESEFVEALQEILQSDQTHRVIAALLAQSSSGWAV